MPESEDERDVMANGSEQAASEEQLITQLARDRREGQDTTQSVKELLASAGKSEPGGSGPARQVVRGTRQRR
jgi:hypothetical protein